MIAPGYSSPPMQVSTGAYIASSAITAKLNPDLLAEPGLDSMQISVETCKDVVQPNGFADYEDIERRDGSVALAVEGVNSVRSDLVVRKNCRRQSLAAGQSAKNRTGIASFGVRSTPLEQKRN